MNAWLYVFDEFRPLDIESSVLLRLARDDPVKLFDIVRDVVEDYVGVVRDVRIHDIYIDPYTHEVLVEFIAVCDSGEISVKIIYSDNPIAMLRKYYRFESFR
ncbi:MAG: hypothetical protein B7O98_02605 [Zestosphaera tikiterensis]|uniref:Uncharacterized protein n=1 Tax=Zestosphaera tikiterensis TaxID=1973259 RepID=A0A2R7Y792_9CREN|nr:MAG: hypothetical protein B7O98_02605 [Zestosphaera tikiterensis]